jgi:hypothetical protein
MERIGEIATRAALATTEVSRPSRRAGLALRAKKDENGLPLRRDPADQLTRLATWRPHAGPWNLGRPLTATEREALEIRAAALEEALEPFGDEDIEAVESDLGAMFNGFRSMRQQGADVAYTVEITRAVLRREGAPVWAIARACQRIAAGRADLDKHWPPNDAEIVAIVRAEVGAYAQRLDEARRTLSAVADEPRAGASARRAPSSPGDGKHAERVAADVAARKAAREGSPT